MRQSGLKQARATAKPSPAAWNLAYVSLNVDMVSLRIALQTSVVVVLAEILVIPEVCDTSIAVQKHIVAGRSDNRREMPILPIILT
mmetsp:Transcript_117687/g.251469  ORF Transcript_117687/g.251469 Transcript_117687/m.251469 type:complete len:86 (+) Transcript_117687:72-329(+)